MSSCVLLSPSSTELKIPRAFKPMSVRVRPPVPWIQRLDGVFSRDDYAEIARLTGLSRARITQIVNLTLLAPEIQEGILFLGGDDATRMQRFERDLRIVLAEANWEEQDRRLPI